MPASSSAGQHCASSTSDPKVNESPKHATRSTPSPGRGACSRRARAPTVLLGALLGVAAGITWARGLAAADVFGPSQSLAFSKLVATGRALSDFDGDGVSALFGGSDCSGFDAGSAPGQFDFPGNGRDEDCSGSDASWPRPRPRIDYPVPDRSGHDVILITVDALRADHLGLHGYPRNTSPHLDALARRSLVFERETAH